jgi:NADH:ubiquinone oxidoreductase subunit 5 (subunit L)/multisubunit Na+/H+ antiporter MnhA subunit
VTSRENKVATVLFIVGVLSIAVGIISGLYYWSQDNFAELGISQARVSWGMVINGAVVGIVFFGFAEIIKLLQGIFNQGESHIQKAASVVTKESALAAANKKTKLNEVSESEKEQIQEFYEAQGRTVENIELTEEEDFFVVTVDGQKELVELGGFKLVIHPYET